MINLYVPYTRKGRWNGLRKIGERATEGGISITRSYVWVGVIDKLKILKKDVDNEDHPCKNDEDGLRMDRAREDRGPERNIDEDCEPLFGTIKSTLRPPDSGHEFWLSEVAEKHSTQGFDRSMWARVNTPPACIISHARYDRRGRIPETIYQ